MPGVVDVLQGLRDVRGPVAVAPEHRQLDPAGGELGLDAGLELPVLLVDRADAAVGAVVVRDLFEPLVRDAAAAGDVAQERDDVVLAFGPAEGGQEHGVVVLGGHPAGLGHVVDSGDGGGSLGIQRAHAQDLGDLGGGDAAAGVERDFLADVVPGFGGAQVAHQVHEVHELGGFQAEDPFPVAEGEGGHRVGDDLGEVPAQHAVVAQHGAALGVGQQVPLVGADEGVDAEPLCRFDAAGESRGVVLGELGLAVHAHGGPDDLGAGEQLAAADVPDGPLKGFGLGAVQPDHDVRIRAHRRHVVAAAVDHAGLGQPRNEGVELFGSIAAAKDVGGALENRPEREELLG